MAVDLSWLGALSGGVLAQQQGQAQEQYRQQGSWATAHWDDGINPTGGSTLTINTDTTISAGTCVWISEDGLFVDHPTTFLGRLRQEIDKWHGDILERRS